MRKYIGLIPAVMLVLSITVMTYADSDLFCRMCGKEIPSDSRFCSYCGAKVVLSDSENTAVNNNVSAVTYGPTEVETKQDIITDKLSNALLSRTCEVLSFNVQTTWAESETLKNSEFIGAYFLSAKSDSTSPENYAGVVLKNTVEIRPYGSKQKTIVEYYYSILLEDIKSNPDGSYEVESRNYSEPECTVKITDNGLYNYYNGYHSLNEFKTVLIDPLLDDYEYSGTGKLTYICD